MQASGAGVCWRWDDRRVLAVLGMGWLLNTSWPGGPEQGLSCRSPRPLHSNTGAADTWVLPAVVRQSPEMCPWGGRSQHLHGDRSQQPAASLAVSSRHLCFKVCGASAPMECPLAGSSQRGSGAPRTAAPGLLKVLPLTGVGPLCLLSRHRFSSTAVGAGCEGADGYPLG